MKITRVQKQTLQVRVPIDLYKEIAAVAAGNFRSINNEILHRVQISLERRAKRKSPRKHAEAVQ
jgi:hypothetical protein